MSHLPTLRGLRVRYGLSQEAEAQMLYESSNKMSKIENGIERPSGALKARIGNLYKTNPNKIIYKPSIPLPKSHDDDTNNDDLTPRTVNSEAQMIDPKSEKIRFDMTKQTFIYEISVIREAPYNLYKAFIEAFSVLANPKLSWQILGKITGISRKALSQENSRHVKREILVEFSMRTLLRLASVPYENLKIRAHFNYQIAPQDAKSAVQKSLKKYHINLDDMHHKIAKIIKHGNTKDLANRMGIQPMTLKGYRAGFNILSMSFREVVTLLDCYATYTKRKSSNKSKITTMTLFNGKTYRTIDIHGEAYILVPLSESGKL